MIVISTCLIQFRERSVKLVYQAKYVQLLNIVAEGTEICIAFS